MGVTKALGRKNDLDKLYTTDENALYCASLLNFSQYDLIIEPSAGGGAFLRALKQLKIEAPILSYDLAPEGDGILKADFLSLSEPKGFSKTLIIGNPPYGQQNSLAISFLNQSMKWESVSEVAFILPKSFRKESLQDRVNRSFGISLDSGLPSDEFLLHGNRHAVNTCFQVWSRLEQPRMIRQKKKNTPLFSITSSKEEAHCRIQRVGGRAGKASKDLSPSSSSNYLICLNGLIHPNEVDEFVEKVNSLSFPTILHTVGPKSLSMDELLTVVEEAYSEKLEKFEENAPKTTLF